MAALDLALCDRMVSTVYWPVRLMFDLTELFWTKRFERNCLGKELGHAEEEVQRGAVFDTASAD